MPGAHPDDAKKEITKTVGFYGGKFLPLHQGHLHCIAVASAIVDELYVILFTNVRDERSMVKNTKLLDPRIRLSWLGEAVAELPNVHILHIADDDYNWEDECDIVKKMIPSPITHVFSSEVEYGEEFEANYPNAYHILVDPDRLKVNISATDIRKRPFRYWKYLPPYVRKDYVKKVAIVGTESCGKSTLVKQLAMVYNTNYIPEIGREYCEKYSDQLTEDMFHNIVMDQLKAERDAARQSNEILFVDTECVVTEYYLGLYFNNVSEVVSTFGHWNLGNYDLYLYLEPDVPWVYDGLRFAGEDEERNRNNKHLRELFNCKGIYLSIITGTFKQRLAKAIHLIDEACFT